MRILLLFLSLFVLTSSFGQNQCKRADRKLKKVEKHIVSGAHDEAMKLLLKIERTCEESFFNCAVGDIYFMFQEFTKSYFFYLKCYAFNGLIDFNNLSLSNFLETAYLTGNYDVFDQVINCDEFNLNITANTSLDKLIKKNNFAFHQKKDSVFFDPVLLSINSDKDEYFPSMPIDTTIMIYTYRNKDLKFQDEDFYISRNQNGIWSNPQKLGDNINSDYREGSLSVSLDGQDVFFASCHRPDSYGGCDLYYSTLINDTLWSQSYNLGSSVNSKYWESQPSISADGNFLFFTSNRDGGYGGSDIWMSRKYNNAWLNPVNLGPFINTSSDEATPFLHYDNQTFYFSSKGHDGFGGFDLYVTHMDSLGNIHPATNLGYPINTHYDESGLIVARDGKQAYYNADISGDLNIYSFNLPNKAHANSVAIINGLVLDSISRLGVQADIFIEDFNHVNSYHLNSDHLGVFSFIMPIESAFSITVSSEHYNFYSENYSLGKEEYVKDLFIILDRLNIGNKINLDNIYYEFDDFSLKEESLVEIEKFANYLLINKTIKVQIEGHTDNIGSELYNYKLSEKRARSVYEALVNFGVPSRQLSYRGYGYSIPLFNEDSEAARLKNRRTQVKVIGSYE